jgi:formate dehydrogenase subunit gamma
VKSANVFEVAPDASTDPAYAKQTNGERAQVQPGNNAPMWRQVGSGVTGYSSLPKSEAPEAGNLIQPFVQYPGSRLTNAGEAWRQVRNGWIIPYGGALLLIVLGGLALAYWRAGPSSSRARPPVASWSASPRSSARPTGPMPLPSAMLAISGLVMAFGQYVLLPVIGHTLFGWLAYALKNVHNFAGPVFAVSLVVVIVTFVRDNLPAQG